MAREQDRFTSLPAQKRQAGPEQPRAERLARPLPKFEVLTLADDAGIGGDPYNSADRWARPDPCDD